MLLGYFKRSLTEVIKPRCLNIKKLPFPAESNRGFEYVKQD